MPNPLEIAPIETWVRVLVGALLIDIGMVALGHARLLRRAFHATWAGWLSNTALASAVRWTGVTLLLAALLTGIELGWTLAVNAPLAVWTAALLAVELLARLRG